jgi:hypothetical protein
MEFKLTINMDNDPFVSDEDSAWEVSKILDTLMGQLIREWKVNGRILMDSNGNHVGHAWVEETETSSVYAKEGN